MVVSDFLVTGDQFLDLFVSVAAYILNGSHRCYLNPMNMVGVWNFGSFRNLLVYLFNPILYKGTERLIFDMFSNVLYTIPI